MCGICGFTGPGDEAVLDRMMRRLEHRGPDEGGSHLDPGSTLGARRLRVIDPGGGTQPITNETGTIWVVMNGEIYNYRELRDERMKKGHRCVSNCGTEVLVHLYEQEGEDGVHWLRGMFAYALWDRERQALLLVRDRVGIKPLYYTVRAGRTEREGGVVFASELPALLAACPPPSLRPAALAQYLTLLYVPGPGTVFDGVQQLLPGELLKIVNGKIETRRYFRPEHSLTRRSGLAAADAATPFLELLFETVRSHLVSDVPLGLLLSGGLDSGAILAMMRRGAHGSLPPVPLR